MSGRACLTPDIFLLIPDRHADTGEAFDVSVRIKGSQDHISLTLKKYADKDTHNATALQAVGTIRSQGSEVR